MGHKLYNFKACTSHIKDVSSTELLPASGFYLTQS